MNFCRGTTKIFAVFFLFFAVFSVARSQDSIYRLEPGTKIRVSMDTEINSGVSGVDDTFTTTLTEPVIVRATIVLPAGTVIEGRIIAVERASTGGKSGSLVVKFETIRLENGQKREIDGVLVKKLKARSMSKTSILAIIGGTVLGALLGAVSGTENGALIGAGIGAGAGAAFSVLRKGKNVRIKTAERFEIELTKQVVLPVRDY